MSIIPEKRQKEPAHIRLYCLGAKAKAMAFLIEAGWDRDRPIDQGVVKNGLTEILENIGDETLEVARELEVDE